MRTSGSPPRGDRQRGPPLTLGRGLLAKLRGRGGKRCPKRRVRAVLPSLRGNREGKKGLAGQATGKKRKKKRRAHLVSPPPFDCCVLETIAHFASPPPVKSRRLFGKRFLCRVRVLLRKNIVFLAFPLSLNVLNKKSDIAAER